MSIALYRRYRPETWETVLAQDRVVDSLRTQLRAGKTGHAYLFSGPRGVGKTTVARLFAKTLACTGRESGSVESCGKCPHCLAYAEGSSLDVIEMDAASQTGVDNVRANIVESSRLAPALAAAKVFIIDEVHMLSDASFNALLKTLEEPAPGTVFILATTDVHKVPLTVQSRCQRFSFRPAAHDVVVGKLRMIAQAEGVESISDDILGVIADEAQGSMRDAESLLQQVLLADDPSAILRVASRELAMQAAEAALVGDVSGTKEALFNMAKYGELSASSIRVPSRVWADRLLSGDPDERLLDGLERSFIAERYFKSAPAEQVVLWFYLGLAAGVPAKVPRGEGEVLPPSSGSGTPQMRPIVQPVVQATSEPTISPESTTGAQKSVASVIAEQSNAVVPEPEKPVVRVQEWAPATESSVQNGWGLFFSEATKNHPSLAVALCVCAPRVREGRIELLVEHALQRDRLKVGSVYDILQRAAITAWGSGISEISVSPEPIQSPDRQAKVSAGTFEDVVAVLAEGGVV